jgi:hypothetical protein
MRARHVSEVIGSATVNIMVSRLWTSRVPAANGAIVTDRPLQHINKKGRPVSQCSHCRTLRKSRSAHVKCDCGNRSHGKGHCGHKGDKGNLHLDPKTSGC